MKKQTSVPGSARTARPGKLSAPAPSEGYVVRSRIDEILDVDVPLTLLVASAGFGKTTALAGWQQRSLRPVAWLTLEPEDSDLFRFCANLTDAIAKAFPGFGDDLRRELNLGNVQPRSLAQAFVNDVDGLAPGAIVVIDDFDEIQGKDVTTLMTEVLRLSSSNLRIVLSSRWDPNIPLDRLRAHGKVQEIRASDLRFSQEESRALLALTLGMEPDQTIVDVLYRRTDGWASGLRLAGIALRSADDKHRLPESDLLSGERHLMNFLMDEVLSRQSEIVRELLVRTSILNRVCGSLADALVDIPIESGSSESILAGLASAGIFVERRENGRTWYHSHELFRDLLRLRLSMEMPYSDIVLLNRRASNWLLDHHFTGEAIDQALLFDDLEYAAKLIERSRAELLGREEWQYLDGWLRRLPEAVIQRHPLLHLTRLRTSIFRGVTAGGHQDLQEIRSRVGAMAGQVDADTLRALQAEVDLLAIHTTLSGEHDPETIIARAERVLVNLPRNDGSGRGMAIMAWAEETYCRGHEEEVLRRLSETLASETDDTGVYYARVMLSQAIVYLRQGRLNRCEQVLHYLLRLTDERDLSLLRAWSLFGLGLLAYERDDIDEAETCFTRILAAPRDVHYWTLREALIGMVLVANARGDAQLAEESMARLIQFILDRGPLSGLEIADSLYARLALMNGDANLVERLDMVATTRNWEHPQYFEVPTLTRAKLHLRRGSPHDLELALKISEGLEEWAARFNDRRRLVEIVLIRALARNALGEYGVAAELFARALDLVGDQPFSRTFLDIGFDLQPLVKLVQNSASAPANLQRVAGLLGLGRTEPSLRPERRANRGSIREMSAVHIYELLTEREVDVLQNMGEHLTNQEIADRLFISPLTVKRHASNIYDKLGVNNRRQAIIKATELGYL